MFGDPVTNDKGWEIRKLKDITVSIQSGNTPKGGKQVYVNSGIMFFRSQNVWRNRIEINDIAYIDEKTHKKMGKTSLKHKDILITKTGRFNTENSSLGRAALFLGEDRSANINGHVYLVRLKEGYVHEFVLYILVTDEYKDYIRKVCVGGIDKRQINKEHLEEFPIIIPPFSLQNEFATIVTKIEEQKALVKQSIEETQQLFDSLMSQYFD
ncbi:restriction endonuclease subunit S [Brevibacillus laterosporus]|uniref:Restriction endonuclease subunit S n=2 Tax=Brevibacillus laterosporus TaxID=1465 RepID=A0AAP8U4K5_BRELA|nr:restriction endonuclease subunit S [Brevibacillus laterosporus]PPA93944.1 restriction endonuclease subunit S [Brevibacillus laterosporus]